MGLYVAVGLPLAWLPNNCPRYGKRTAASGFQLTVGNASGIMAPFVSFSHGLLEVINLVYADISFSGESEVNLIRYPKKDSGF